MGKNQEGNDAGSERVSEHWRQIIRRKQGVEVVLSSLYDRDRRVVNYQPEESFEDQQPAEGNDESGHFLAHDYVAHAEPNENADEEGGPHPERRRPMMLEDQHTREPAEETDTAARREINVTRKNNQQHAQGERGGNRQLGHEEREIACAKKVRRHDSEERADDDECDQHREVAKGFPGLHFKGQPHLALRHRGNGNFSWVASAR